MEFGVLGRVGLRTAAGWATSGGVRQQLLLACLLLEAGRVIGAQTLAERVWDGDPPGDGPGALWPHISRIRKELRTAGLPGPVLERAGAGYLLRVEPDAVDANRFAGLQAAAQRAGSDADRSQLLGQALALWRGEPLAGLPGAWAATVRSGLQQQRIEAVTAWSAAQLGLGHPGRVLAPLLELAREHPLVEPVTQALMQALAAAGRRAEALTRYLETRRRLADELGIEPGAALQQAYQELLQADGRPAPTRGPARHELDLRRRPAQLPPDGYTFTGRQAELAFLDAWARQGPPLVVLSGPGGVGKTALALHWTHRALDRFPDGQLYIDLRGFDRDHPVTATDALAGFLEALGVPGPDIPLDQAARAARFRSEVAGRRLLLLLDNASGPEHVRPLLPGAGPGAVLVTSRDTMSGLVAVDGGRRLALGALDRDAGLALLRRLGVAVDRYPDAAAELVELGDGLPLALRIAAELAGSGDPAQLVDQLKDHAGRVDALQLPGDDRGRLSTVFSWSYRHLPPSLGWAFRSAALHPGDTLDDRAAAALTGFSLEQARFSLDLLARASLLQPAGPGRFRMHDLARAYAVRLGGRPDDPDDLDRAFRRLADHYLATALSAMDILHPGERHRRPAMPADPVAVPRLGGRDAAIQWLDAERSTLLALVRAAADRGAADVVAALSRTVYRDLNRGWFHQALTLYSTAVAAARSAGDRQAEAEALHSFGLAHFHLGRMPAAREQLEAALALFDASGDPDGQARCLVNLGSALSRLGDLPAAVRSLERGRLMFERAGDLDGQAHTLINLGVARARLGRNDHRAEDEALVLYQLLGDRSGEACALLNRGACQERLGDLDAAERSVRAALVIHREIGETDGEAYDLGTIGVIELGQGRPEQAAGTLRRSIELHRQTGNRGGEAEVRTDLGRALEAGGRAGEAARSYELALLLATEAGDRFEQARAHRFLGELLAGTDPARACGHLAAALARFEEVGSAQAPEVRARLEQLRLLR